jgi:hypothetical protein
MGLVNTVVPVVDRQAETVKWCREIAEPDPTRPTTTGTPRRVVLVPWKGSSNADGNVG